MHVVLFDEKPFPLLQNKITVDHDWTGGNITGSTITADMEVLATGDFFVNGEHFDMVTIGTRGGIATMLHNPIITDVTFEAIEPGRPLRANIDLIAMEADMVA